MFIGHFAVGLAAKRAAPRLSLAVLFAAALLADILWPLLVAAGLEEVRIDPGNTALTPLDFVSYPWSHSLVMLAVWAVLFGLAVRHRDPRAFAVVSALVLSHWVLDFITHRPDMPLYPGGPKFGLSLWNSIPGTVCLEVAMFLAGAWIYLRSTRARDGAGRWGTVVLLSTLLLIYVGDVASRSTPPGVNAIVVVGIIGGVLLTAWAGWADRHRDAVTSDRS
jgi:membrane-bound metal-dependent hydrolase YbcI (DUF457 family)